jgi:hypothetical protein
MLIHGYGGYGFPLRARAGGGDELLGAVEGMADGAEYLEAVTGRSGATPNARSI